MTSEGLRGWRERLKLNRVKAAEKLGLSRNTYSAYEEGRATIPLYIAYACAAIAFGLPPQQ